MTIKTKLFFTSVGLVLISIIIIASLGFYSIYSIGKNMQKISGDTLRAQTEKFLVQLTSSVAERNDLILEKVRKDADNAAGYASNLYSNPEAFSSSTLWNFDEHMYKGDGGQYKNSKDETSSIFVVNHIKVDDELKKMVGQSDYLNYLFPKIIENEPNEVAVWIVGLTEKSKYFTFYYPNIDLGNISPVNEVTTEQIFFAVADPKNNPERKVVWTPVYDDPAGQGLMITASAPVYTKKGFSGVLGIDVTLNTIIKNIEEYNPIEGSYFFLIDKDGRAIALPEQGYQDILERPQKAGEYNADLNTATNEFLPIIKKMKEGEKGFEEVQHENKDLFVAYTPLNGAGFSIGSVVDKTVALKSVRTMQGEIDKTIQAIILKIFLPSGLIILFLALTMAFLLSKSISSSLIKLKKAAFEVGRGNLDTKIEIKTNDEIGELAKAFGKMSSDLKESGVKLQEYSKTLENKVRERTIELESKNLEQEKANKKLKQMNEIMIDRELKMIELKKELDKLKKK